MSKKLYEQPTTKTFVVRFEGMLCQSPGPGSGYNRSGNAGNTMSEDDNYVYSF